MDVLIRYDDSGGASSASGVVNYFLEHLQTSKEMGGFPRVPGYLSRDGKVVPVFDKNLWRRLGWDGEGLPPKKLIRNLCDGFDRDGNKLSGSSGFRRPQETIISLYSELSEALKDRPEIAHAILCEALREHVLVIEERAFRRRSGKGRKANPEWAPGKVPTLSYCHQENKLGETSFHIHTLAFPVAKALETERWFTYDNAAHMAGLSKKGGGRERVTQAIIASAARFGYRVEVAQGKAHGTGPQGARVTTPDGRIFERGTVARERRAEILAAQEMVRALGSNPLTPKEIELVRRQTGRFPKEIRGVRRIELLQKKLETMGFLNSNGQIAEPTSVSQCLRKMEAGMAEAQAALEDLSQLPFSKPAASIIKAKRQELTKLEPTIIPNPNQARIRWTAAYDMAISMVANNPDGLRTDDLDKPTRDNLSKLKRAGILCGEKVAGRMVYRLSEEGERRFQSGLVAQAHVESVVRAMVQEAKADDPGITRGRLESVGITVVPSAEAFEVGAVGRVLVDPELVKTTEIQEATPSIGDKNWWKRMWEQVRRLPDVIRRAILRPDEVQGRWGWPAEDRHQAAASIAEARKERRRIDKERAASKLALNQADAAHRAVEKPLDPRQHNRIQPQPQKAVTHVRNR